MCRAASITPDSQRSFARAEYSRADILLNHKLIIHRKFAQQSALLSPPNAEQIVKATF